MIRSCVWVVCLWSALAIEPTQGINSEIITSNGKQYVSIYGEIKSDAYDKQLSYTTSRIYQVVDKDGHIVSQWELKSLVKVLIKMEAHAVIDYAKRFSAYNAAETLEITTLRCPDFTDTNIGHCKRTPYGNKVRKLQQVDPHKVWKSSLPRLSYTVTVVITIEEEDGTINMYDVVFNEHNKKGLVIDENSYMQTVVISTGSINNIFRFDCYVVHRENEGILDSMAVPFEIVGFGGTNLLGMLPSVWKKAVIDSDSNTKTNELTFIGSPPTPDVFPADQLLNYRTSSPYLPSNCNCVEGCDMSGDSTHTVRYTCSDDILLLAFSLHISADSVTLTQLIGKPVVLQSVVSLVRRQAILNITIGNEGTMPGVVTVKLLRCISNSPIVGSFTYTGKPIKHFIDVDKTTVYSFLLTSPANFIVAETLALNPGRCNIQFLQATGSENESQTIINEATISWLGTVSGYAPGTYVKIDSPVQCVDPDIRFMAPQTSNLICLVACSCDQTMEMGDIPSCRPVDCLAKYGHSRPYFSSIRSVCISTEEKAAEDGVSTDDLFIPQYIPFSNVSVDCGKGKKNTSTNILAVPCICPEGATRYETREDNKLYMCLDDFVFADPEVPSWGNTVFRDVIEFFENLKGKSFFEIIKLFFTTKIGRILLLIMSIILLIIFIPLFVRFFPLCVKCFTCCCKSYKSSCQSCKKLPRDTAQDTGNCSKTAGSAALLNDTLEIEAETIDKVKSLTSPDSLIPEDVAAFNKLAAELSRHNSILIRNSILMKQIESINNLYTLFKKQMNNQEDVHDLIE
ncbi:Hypothetical protein GLP15_2454 [Giardia lamblia P15]|uniref:Generative cell specific-1/HAP2 domain-containing protein n=1 Tax=Giardia intestinalis (strain P15) TaxID=658858 RepID=E1F6R9_GIAIA|nr:Hypothetical protein GLP15_2454 [Giardia lamblia P15]